MDHHISASTIVAKLITPAEIQTCQDENNFCDLFSSYELKKR